MRKKGVVLGLTVVLALLSGCSDETPTGPAVGELEVTTATAGEDIDPVGYVISVDGGSGQAIGANAQVTIPGLSVGAHNVELSGVAPNCTVEGGNPRSITVTASGTARVTFNVACQPLVGGLEITISTTGEDIDPDGYVISVDGADAQAIGVNEQLSFSGLTPGEYNVELGDVAANCTVAGNNPRTVTVTGGNTAVTGFTVACQPLVPLELTGKIAFHTDRDGNFEIYVMNADGSEQTRLTNNAAFDGVPAISPDGTRILFETDRDGNNEIYVMNVDGTGQINLTNHLGWDERPSWSPDGTKIVFVSDRDGDNDIFVMNADGSSPANLTSAAGNDRPATWSPDGTKLAFSSNRTGAFEIFVMNADGSNVVQVTDTPASADFAPAWSPDGTLIAFTSNASSPEIHVMNADGSGRVSLTNSPGADNRWPSWSPDGSWIAFSTNRTGDYEVFVMRADGTQPTNVSNRPGSVDVAGWPQAWGP